MITNAVAADGRLVAALAALTVMLLACGYPPMLNLCAGMG
jgi:hypothetical protein